MQLGDPISWSPFQDEIAWIGEIGSPPVLQLFKVATGLPPVPAVVGTLQPGTRVRIRLKVDQSPNLSYVLAASFGRDVGIATARGRIPLDLDPLLLASVSGAPPFVGFRGVLDGAGRADAFLDLPSLTALIGTRFFLGYVTLHPAFPAGILTISESVPVFVQPMN